MEPKNEHCILSVLSLIILITGFCSTVFSDGCKIIYVDEHAAGSNDGTSWPDAYNYLQDALADANTSVGCDQIWVAAGTYKPDYNLADPINREATFSLINNVALYGGFPSGGGLWETRTTNPSESNLSGDILEDDDPCYPEWTREDNSYHVVTTIGVDETTVLDGFTVTAGNANGNGEDYPQYDRGAGVYNYGGSPTINNCTFRDNMIYNDCGYGGGGGIYSYDGSPVVTGCTFSGNVANKTWAYGGGIYCGGNGNPEITGCTFSGNIVNGEFAWGGGIYCGGNGKPVVTGCTFSGNSATSYEGRGGGMCNDFGSSLTIIDCNFSGNSALFGGGMYCLGNDVNIINCTFTENFAYGMYTDTIGGGIYNEGNNLTVTDCKFNGNLASCHNRKASGGGMYNFGSNLTVTNCTFSGNSTYGTCDKKASQPHRFASVGGGMYNRYSNATITNCVFSGNLADGNEAIASGGGMYNDGNSVITNCIFTGNMVDANNHSSGGGMSNSYKATIINSTFSCNSASSVHSLDQGGAIYGLGPNTIIANCILYDNTSSLGSEISAPNLVKVSYSDIKGGPNAVHDPYGNLIWGLANIDADPNFVQPGSNYRLLSVSLCIDAGDNDSVPPRKRYEDLDGLWRIADGDGDEYCIVDMGAYEFPSYIYVPVGDFDNSCYVNFQDFAMLALTWFTAEGQPGYDPVFDISFHADSLIDENDLEIFVDNWLAGVE